MRWSTLRVAASSLSQNFRKNSFEFIECEPSCFEQSFGNLNADYLHQFLHSIGALLQRRLLLAGQFDLDDLLQAASAKLAGNADEQAVDAVLALQVCGARQDLLLILEDGFHHLGRRR